MTSVQPNPTRYKVKQTSESNVLLMPSYIFGAD